MVVLLHRHDALALDEYWRVALHGEEVTIDAPALEAVSASRQAMERHLATGVAVYGVTTGLGYFANRPVPPSEQAALQRAIVVGRAAGIGPPEPEHVVRGTMLLRLNGFLAGLAGVTPDLCTYIADRLNAGWYPVVPASRPGTAGETIPLCHLFQTFVGEGDVFVDGAPKPAAEALAAHGTAPYRLQLKEGLALVNGAPHATSLGAHALRRCERLLDDAIVVAALTVSVMGSSGRPFSTRIAAAKGDPGQFLVTTRLAELVAGGGPEGTQGPVSLRVIPQVHGAVHDVVDQLRRQVERELHAVTDSPLFLAASESEDEGFYPSGNFHSQALSLALDNVAIAMTQIGSLSEKRLHRLLDSRYSGLPDQLSADAARGGSGLVSMHKAVVGLVAENRLLASPASIHAADTSSGQEDFQAFTGLAYSKLITLLDNVELALSYELVAARQAHALGSRQLPPRVAAVLEVLATQLPVITADRSLAPVVERARSLLRDHVLSVARPSDAD
jgi:histidine ammonia-lyase